MSPENCRLSRCQAKARLRSAVVAAIMLGLLTGTTSPETPKPVPEPRAFSIYPLGNQPGASYDAQIRGVKFRTRRRSGF